MFRSVVLASAFLLAGSAMAAKSDFPACDGYPEPTSKTDGMTKAPLFWGLASATADVRKDGLVAVGPAGAVACKAALADPALLPAYALRRANLLQALAVHQLKTADTAGALESLAQSDEAGHADPLFADGIGLGNHAVRAWALVGAGKPVEARAETAALVARRPYAPSVVLLANQIRQQTDPGLDGQIGYLKAEIPLSPGMLLAYFASTLTADRMADAAAVGGQISFDLPKTRGAWTIDGQNTRQYIQIKTRADIAGAYAYALLASGKAAAAHDAMKAARADLEATLAPLPPSPDGSSPSKAAQLDFSQRTFWGNQAKPFVDNWDTAMTLREGAPKRPFGEYMNDLMLHASAVGTVMPDLVAQANATTPDQRTQRDDLVRQIETRRQAARPEDTTPNFQVFLRSLPRAETVGMQPNFHQAGDGYFLSDNGFSTRKGDDPDMLTVRFTHDVASKATVEELALLYAAKLAVARGKDGMILLSRITLQRTIHQMMYGRAIADLPDGNEAGLDVAFVDRAALPDRYKDVAWRLLDPKQIIAGLGQRYPDAAAAPAHM